MCATTVGTLRRIRDRRLSNRSLQGVHDPGESHWKLVDGQTIACPMQDLLMRRSGDYLQERSMMNNILTPKGRLDNTTAAAFEEAVKAATAAGATRLLIDFSEVPYISSGGLRVILVAAKSLAANGGRLALCSLNPRVAEIIDMSGFAAFSNMSIHPGRDAARAALE
jgi:anti-anti-sigma factor